MTDLSVADVRRLALANIAKRAAEGKALSEADWRRLEEFQRGAAPAAPSPSAADGCQWPDAAAAAKELRVPVQTVRDWCHELGVDYAQGVNKVALYRGLWLRELNFVSRKGRLCPVVYRKDGVQRIVGRGVPARTVR